MASRWGFLEPRWNAFAGFTMKTIPENVKNITGNRFGRLVVLSFSRIFKKASRWIVRCDCGTIKEISGTSIRSGAVKSCGCLDREKKTKHGLYGTRTYHAWESIKARCHNENDKGYPRYGGRGIKVCDEWLHSFENFYRDMGEKPVGNYSIDRIKNDIGYQKDNCRWATSKEQANNRRTNVVIEIDGQKKNLSQWCELFGIHASTVQGRLRNGWSPKDAVTTPAKIRQHQHQ
jgi:hypothetical protein